MENENKLRSFIKTTLHEFLNEQKLNEISSDTFKSAINVAKERNSNGRIEKLSSLYFNDFIGKSIFDEGKIKNITILSDKNEPSKLLLNIIYPNINTQISSNDLKKYWIYYHIDKDMWLGIDWKMNRTDARLLGKIAEKINPDTKYKETGKYFDIKGW